MANPLELGMAGGTAGMLGVDPQDPAATNGMLQGAMPMLLQYLSAAGQDIGAGKPIGANVNAATQKNLAAQSQTKSLQKILAGGGKITQDGKGFTITGGNHLLEQGVFGGGASESAGTGASTGAGSAPGATTNIPTLNSMIGQTLSGNTTINPPASPLGNINASDLVGLTPENISQALALGQNQEKLTQEGVNSQYDNMLKQAQADNLTSGGKDTADIKNYQYAVKNGFKGTFEDWKNAAETASIKEYQFAVSQGYPRSYPEWKMELAKASGTNINLNERKLEYQRDEARQAGMVAMDEGKEVTKAMNKVIESEDFQNKNFALQNSKDPVKKEQYQNNRRIAKAAVVQEFIDNGKGVADWKFDKKTGRATVIVTWPNKEVRTYTYDLDK